MALPTFQQMLAKTNPTGVGFGGSAAGLTPTSGSPTGTAGVTYSSGPALPGTPVYGSPGGAGAAAAPAPDPYAAYGGQAAYNKLVGDYNAQKSNTFGSITDRIGTAAGQYGGSVQDLVENLTAGQQKIDSKAVQNELARQQGNAGVLDMIGHGVRSGGVVLANKNASNSSAAEAIARAYGDIGRRQETSVGNQYAQGNDSIAQDQSALDLSRSQGIRHSNEDKTTVINGIVSDAQTALTALNSAAATASLPDRVDIEAQKQAIRTQALQALQQYDAQLNSANNIHPADTQTNRTRAASLATAGTAATTPFTYDTNIPLQFQNTGPFASDLPLFTFPSNSRKQTAGA